MSSGGDPLDPLLRYAVNGRGQVPRDGAAQIAGTLIDARETRGGETALGS
ncbi:MAG: hypothetical protein ACR2F6_06785 [Mycobacteriales bacterium]